MADEESFDEGFYRDMGESFDTRGDQSYHVNIWRDAFKLWIGVEREEKIVAFGQLLSFLA